MVLVLKKILRWCKALIVVCVELSSLVAAAYIGHLSFGVHVFEYNRGFDYVATLNERGTVSSEDDK